MKHTEGKLEISSSRFSVPQGTDIIISHGDKDEFSPMIAKVFSDGGRLPAQANAQRLVDCWNGCVDIKNPLAVGELLNTCKTTLDIINSYSHIPAQFEACQILQQAINKVERG